jgi:hypothetical protein
MQAIGLCYQHSLDVCLLQDYTMNPPCQELVAKDVHGVEWKFRHIYRGISTILHTMPAISQASVIWFNLYLFYEMSFVEDEL